MGMHCIAGGGMYRLLGHAPSLSLRSDAAGGCLETECTFIVLQSEVLHELKRHTFALFQRARVLWYRACRATLAVASAVWGGLAGVARIVEFNFQGNRLLGAQNPKTKLASRRTSRLPHFLTDQIRDRRRRRASASGRLSVPGAARAACGMCSDRCTVGECRL